MTAFTRKTVRIISIIATLTSLCACSDQLYAEKDYSYGQYTGGNVSAQHRSIIHSGGFNF